MNHEPDREPGTELGTLNRTPNPEPSTWNLNPEPR